MKLKTALALGVLAAGTFALAKDAGTSVDAGTFGVFVGGRRVATETFSIQQGANGGSVISSQVKAEGSTAANQTSELKLSATGDLIKYEWHDLSSKAELTLIPQDQFLMEKIAINPNEKPAEQPFLMPSSTLILDNNFFVQREILIWRYLGSACKQSQGKTQCPLGAAPFGVIVPQERNSMRVSVEVVGKEKVKINGADRDLLRLNLKEENGEWTAWVDDQNNFKLMRIAVEASNTEVLRD